MLLVDVQVENGVSHEAVGEIGGGDGLLNGREREFGYGEFLKAVGGGIAYLVGFVHQDEVAPIILESRIGAAGANEAGISASIACLFPQLSERGIHGIFSRVNAACGKLPKVFRRTETELIDHNKSVFTGTCESDHPIVGLDDIEVALACVSGMAAGALANGKDLAIGVGLILNR